MQDALRAVIGKVLLFPVYADYKAQGANFTWKIVGFVGFKLTGFDARGSSGKLYGSFTHTIWSGIQSDDPTAPDWGAYALAMVQ